MNIVFALPAVRRVEPITKRSPSGGRQPGPDGHRGSLPPAEAFSTVLERLSAQSA